MAIDWNAIYNEEFNKLPDIAALLQGQQDSALGDLKNTYESNQSKLRDQLNEALSAAYVNGEQAKRDLTTRLAAQGITGGMTETAAGDILREQRNARNDSQKTYDTSNTDLTNNYNTGMTNTRNNYGQLIATAQSNRATQASGNAGTRAGLLQQEDANSLARDQFNLQKQQAENQAALEREKWEWQKQQAAAQAARESAAITASSKK